MQALSKPKSEQECRKAHEPYALHKKIRNDDCLLSKKILEMEGKFKRFNYIHTLCTYYIPCRYSEQNKVPTPRERLQFNAVIKEAEATVIQKGNYQIGKQIKHFSLYINLIALTQIVFCTCSEASSVRVADNINPTHVIIDEAAMATEPEAMIPIQLADHVTLIGDHQQLQVMDYL